MTSNSGQIFYPMNYSELFNRWTAFPDGVLYAGGTTFFDEKALVVPKLPGIIFSLEGIEELHNISRTEKHLEIGSQVKLGQILDLGNTVPKVLRDCIENIAWPQLRNMATIGGNICFSGKRLDCPGALAALDAMYEFRNAQSSRWISASRFISTEEKISLNPQELLTRIRIPLDNWDYSAYFKFSGHTNKNRAAVFLAKLHKNILSDIRVIYKTDTVLRDKNSESILIGKGLPLSRRTAGDFISHWDSFLFSMGNIDDLSRKEFSNFLEMNLNGMSE